MDSDNPSPRGRLSVDDKDDSYDAGRRGGKERSRSRDRHHKSSREHKRRDRSRSRDRRRSRSRGHDRDRRRRSRSRSRDRRRRSRSRSRDRRSYRRRDYRSRSRSRSPSEGDMGGYKPRKRQEPAKPTASMFATNDPYAHLRTKQPMDPTEAMRLWQEQMLKSRQLVLAQQAKSAVQQANKAQRELYIGNLAAGQVSEPMLLQVFNSALIAAFPEAGRPGQEPVVKVNIHSDGRYGFVEFRSAEYASAALELNGQINLMNQALSIGRPASYVDPNKVHQAAAQAEAALAAFRQGLPLPPNTVNLPTALAPGSAGAAMAAAGNAAADSHNAAAAAAGALPGVLPTAAMGAAAVPGVLPGVLPGGLLGAAVGAGVAGLVPGAPALPTPYVVVTNMISAAVLEDDEEYEELVETNSGAQAASYNCCCQLVLLDLKEECERYGDVVDAVVPRPADPKQAKQLFGTGNYGKAFVEFKDAVEAAKARERIHGRMFAGHQVLVTYISREAYEEVKQAFAPAAAPRRGSNDGSVSGREGSEDGGASGGDAEPANGQVAAGGADVEMQAAAAGVQAAADQHQNSDGGPE